MLPVRSVINARSSMQERRAAQVVRQGADSGKSQAPCQGFGLLRRIVLQLLLALALCAGLSVTAHAQVQHIYDENGRLVGTIDPTGSAARFTYDAAGNITAIARFTSTQVSIIEFTPNSGPGSSTVTIWGTGFSATPASNTVTFNGTAGTVTAATVNKLTVTVPGGATTGAIAVTSPNGNATSATSFTVAANPAAPTISSFSPSIVAAGATITINGTGFLTPAIGNKLRLNATYSQITSATTTQLQTTLPTYTLGGKVAVATQWGTASSANDLFVVPTGYIVGDVVDTARLTGGATRTFNFPTAGKIALAVVDAAQGERLAVNITSSSIASGVLRLYTPDGEWMFDTPSLNQFSRISIPVPRTGSYTLALVPSPGQTGSVTISAQPISAVLTLDGTATPYSWSGSALYATGFVFDAPIHANYGLGLTVTTLPAGTLFVNIYGPTGMPVGAGSFSGTNGLTLDLLDLTMTGRYLVEMSTGGNPAGTPSGNVSFWLSSDLTGTLTPGNSVTYPASARPGQNGRYTFSGTAGDYMSLVTDITGSFPSGLTVRAFRPDGQQQGSPAFPIYDLGKLPVTGTYSVFVSPIAAVTPNTASAVVTLQKSVTGTITPGAAATNFSLAAGQNARYTFTVANAAGQNIGAAINVTTLPAGQIQFRLRDASDTVVTEVTASIPGTSLNASNLTVGQTYTLEVDPSAAVATSGSILLSNDFSGTLAIGGANTTFNASGRAGQNGRYNFSLTTPPDGNLGLGVSTVNNLIGSDSVTFSLIQPNASVINLGGLNAPGSDGASFDLSGLNQSGTYTVFVNPNALAAPSFDLTLSSDETGSFSVGATGFTFNTTRPGRNARYTFAGTVNQRLTLRATTPSGSFQNSGVIRVLRANGTQVGSDYPLPINSDVIYYLPLLPATETYTVFVTPTGGRTGQTTIRLIEAAAGSVTVDGSVVSFTPSPAGQYARYTVTPSLTAGQALGIGLKVTGASGGTTQINFLDPSGSPLPGGSTTITNTLNTVGELNMRVGSSGSYLIDLLPSVAGTPTLALTVSNDLAGTITPGGSQVTFSSSRVGQNGSYTFSANSGQRVNLTVNSGATLGSVQYMLLRPGTFSFFDFAGFGDTGGTKLFSPLDATGTWTLFVSPLGTSIPGSTTFGISLQ